MKQNKIVHILFTVLIFFPKENFMFSFNLKYVSGMDISNSNLY